MIDHLINQCKRHFDEEVKIEDPRKCFDDAIIELRIKKNGDSVETQQATGDNFLKIPTARHLEVPEQQPDFETLPRSKTDVSVISAILKDRNDTQQQKRKVNEVYQTTGKFSVKNFAKPNQSYINESKKNEVESIRKQSHDKIKKDIANSTAINIYKKS